MRGGRLQEVVAQEGSTVISSEIKLIENGTIKEKGEEEINK